MKNNLLFVFFLSFAACIPKPATRPVPPPPSAETKAEPKTETSLQEPDNERVQGRQKVLVGLRVDVEKITVSCEGSLSIKTGKGVEATWPGDSYTFTAKDGQVVVNGQPRGHKFSMVPSNPSAYHLAVGQKQYRETLIVKASSAESLTVINELGIDDYLKGVLPREVVEAWHFESLKVQAVASRTYMVAELGRHRAQGFDLCADVHCQVYGGMVKESEKCSRAVEATKGQILVYNSKPVWAYFHSNCGGTTEQIQPVWGRPNLPYLPRKKCGYGTGDPRYKWTLTLKNEDILAALKKSNKVKGSRVKEVRVKTKSASGRAQTVTVVTDQGTYNMMGNEFRIALHPEKVRSTLWTGFKRVDGGYKITGMGWGHGVGMCQWGAKGQAEHGRNYRDILEYYYPHSKLQTWNRL